MNIWQDLKKPFVVLAPMEGVTDVIFRQVVARAGRPDLFFTEFTNVSSYVSEKGRANALERLMVSPTDVPIIAQIWGKNPEHFAVVAEALGELEFAGIDLNFGCPDKHVNKAGGGAAMIRTPELALECLRNAMGASVLPVSVKTRLGWSDAMEYREWLSLLLAEHPAALTVHLRTKKEMSKVPAHYELIPKIVKLRDEISLETKLVINGDIRDLAHVMELHAKYPEVDGFMIGRGVFANPYCFTDYQPTRDDLMELLKMHLGLFEEYKNRSSRSIRDDGSERRSEPCNDRRERGGDERTYSYAPSNETYSYTPSYETLKHFFKIYVNNFPGAKELRAKLMETHLVEEAWGVLSEIGVGRF